MFGATNYTMGYRRRFLIPLPRDRVLKENTEFAQSALYREIKSIVENTDTPMTRDVWIHFIQKKLNVDKQYAKGVYQDLRDEGILSVIYFKGKNAVLISSSAPIWAHDRDVVDNPNAL